MPIRDAVQANVDRIAEIHKDRFADHFTGAFSSSLLARYYETFLGRSVFLVYRGGGTIQAFALGLSRTQLAECRQAFLVRQALRCGWETLTLPSRWAGTLSRMWGLVLPAPRLQLDSPEYVLLSIAVDATAEGTGVGAAMLQAFESRVRRLGNGYSLCVRRDNPRAVGFYERAGFTFQGGLNDKLFFVKRWRTSQAEVPPAEGVLSAVPLSGAVRH